ncbi:insulinase family protein [Fulvivirga maritima]|uniref:M16 family metallopeptidase n=1 Tax=Fulvivirga maritima TaxID=2904247 RepID=UPI001F165127|nr:M16 family metallopeptidase [Fulvivirga maritima]UII24724.1 insulinase family protein [Fulvivirga maritima]
MLLKKKWIVALVAVMYAHCTYSQFTTPIPLNDEVVHGKLDNGLEYYVLHNEEPKGRASFYFAQNVGAILEEDSQNGLAHFLEHMAFNGTQNFDGKGIIKMLEKNGVSFGKEINAYTATDQTIYNISKVPVNSNEWLLDSCLWVLHDWSGYLSLKPEEIDAERGVVSEEWRTRRTSDVRLKNQTDQVLYKGSKYAKRDVIGDMDIINHFEYDKLRDYYHKWYRPDLQAVIVVGDVDAKAVEQKIKDIFSSIPMPENPAKREYYEIPENEELLFGTAKDEEAKYTRITLRYKKEEPLQYDTATTRSNVLMSVYTNILSNRYKEKTLDPNSKSLAIYAYTSPISRLTSSFNIQAIPKKDSLMASFAEGYTEIERLVRYGVTRGELERSKKQFVSSYDNYLKNKDKVDNDSWADQLTDYFLKAKPFLAPQDDYNLIVGILNDLTLKELNDFAKSVITKENRVLLVTGPEKGNETFPTKDEFIKVMESVENMNLEPYKEDDNDTDMVEADLQPVAIANTFDLPGIEKAKGYELKNGARVVLLPTEYAPDEIVFTSFSKGGKSLIATEQLPSADIATLLARSSGIAGFTSIELKKKLTGKVASMAPYIGDYSEGFSGSSNQEDFETMLQLLYLYFESPRFDPDIYELLKTQYQNQLDNVEKDNGKVMKDSISLATTNHNPRTILFNQQFLDALDFDQAQKVYQDRIKNASDFTFVFVGNIPANGLELIQKYIGNVNGEGPTEKAVDHNERPADGKTIVHFEREMETPKTSVYLRLIGDIKYNRKNASAMYIIGQLLSKRFLETIREEEGGSYGVGVQGYAQTLPNPYFNLVLSFDCNPDKEERLMEIVYEEIEKLASAKPIEDDLINIKKAMIKGHDEDMDKNSFWKDQLTNLLFSDLSYVDRDEYAETINSIDGKAIQKLAKYILKKADSVEVIMTPAGK